jgi:hypothetical protein
MEVEMNTGEPVAAAATALAGDMADDANKLDKAAKLRVRELALTGAFDEIEAAFGAKTLSGAKKCECIIGRLACWLVALLPIAA